MRNPLDSCLSWLNLVATGNHASKAPFAYEELYPNYLDGWIRDCIVHINNWMQCMMKDSRFRDCPMLFVRFEDLVMDPEPQLYDIMKFLLGVRDLSGTNAERRIKEVIAKGAAATQTYNLKDTTKKCNANVGKYTAE